MRCFGSQLHHSRKDEKTCATLSSENVSGDVKELGNSQ
jgi:hypothetical protein